jgi:hypothetical protein
MAEGLRSSVGAAATPFTRGPYTWDQRLSFGAGTAATAVSLTSAAKVFEVYGNSTATSGDSRAIYTRLWLSGAAGSGESLRAFTTVNNVAADTAHGAHISLSLGTSGTLTGLGVGVRAQLQVSNAAPSGGTFSALQAEIYGDGASSSVSSMTECSFMRFVADGATADIKATIDTSGYLFSIQGLSAASGKLFQANTAAAASHALRIKIGATPYYIMLTNTGA